MKLGGYPVNSEYWSDAVNDLAQADSVMATLIQRHPHGKLTSRGEPFTTLARAITGQQISVKAADAVWSRLVKQVEPTSVAVALLSIETLRSCGYSYRKSEYLHDLARYFNDGLLSVTAWATMDDDAVIRDLIRIRGIGRWSAEMFLLFNLLRPDVLPLADIGLQTAMLRLYPQLVGRGLPGLREQGEQWRPWRSVATWYLWRSLDPVDVAY